MAKQIGDLKYMTSSSLPQITEQFSVITKEAERAGFVTNRFYSAVLQATSGMAYYGVRIEETTKVLATMGTLIGQVYGEQLMKGLGAKFTTSYKENLKHIMTHGSDRVAKTMSMSYEMRLKQYARDFEELGKTQEERQKKLTDIMNSSDQSEATRKAIAAGVTDGKVLGDIQQLLALKKGGEGNMAAQMTGMSAMGAGGKLLNMMYASNIFGEGRTDAGVMDEAFRTGDPVLVAALEEVEKISGVQGEQVMSLTRNAQQAFRLAKQTAKEGGTTEDLSGLAQKLGLEINKEGQIVKDGVEIKGWQQLFMATVDSNEDLKAQMESEKERAIRLAATTKSINDVLEQSILGILIDLYALLEPAINFFMRDKSRSYKEEQKEARRRKSIEYGQEASKAGSELEAATQKLGTLKAGSPEYKKQQEVIKDLEKKTDAAVKKHKDAKDLAEATGEGLRKKQVELYGERRGLSTGLAGREVGNIIDEVIRESSILNTLGRGGVDILDPGRDHVTAGFKAAGVAAGEDPWETALWMEDQNFAVRAYDAAKSSGNFAMFEKAFGGAEGAARKFGEIGFAEEGDEKEFADALKTAYLDAMIEQEQKEKAFEDTALGKAGKVTQEIIINQLGGDEAETVRIIQQFLDKYFKKR
jgi:hypothetical protein